MGNLNDLGGFVISKSEVPSDAKVVFVDTRVYSLPCLEPRPFFSRFFLPEAVGAELACLFYIRTISVVLAGITAYFL